MALDVSTSNLTKLMKKEGLTSGNEAVFALDPNKKHMIMGVLTSGPGSATVMVDIDDEVPGDFTNFVNALDENETASFVKEVNSGIRWIGIEIDSGTWTFSARQGY